MDMMKLFDGYVSIKSIIILFFLRFCELANRCCVIKNERGFDERIDIDRTQ